MNVSELGVSLGFDIQSHYFVVTYHPVTLGDEAPEESYQSILDALDSYPEYQVVLTYPNADDGGRRIIPMLEAYANWPKIPRRVLAILNHWGKSVTLSAVKHAAAVIGELVEWYYRSTCL